MTAAGAGPSSAIASAAAMKAGPIRTSPVRPTRNCPTSASASSERNSSIGPQSSASVAITATVTARREQHDLSGGEKDVPPAVTWTLTGLRRCCSRPTRLQRNACKAGTQRMDGAWQPRG